ncbi:sulfatase-modifying factor protein [Chitinophaga silvatica]|uniref:Sulfatase-modifying factor protein n=1 Tax=Chitinophaga silvatica TaxID=2282649 RepID=A0A3E1Y3P3_9BACT|nr:SUMF1/EgtB/PvdO family nonheme iron enzyme [Chitinophaga silvatica]RFS19276.1 sulfatase-modifying factor protein [Chitinophaga silvatica]
MSGRLLYLLLLLSIGNNLIAQTQQMITVPEGTYTVGDKHSIVNPFRKVHLPAFEIAVTEVTNRQFSAFVAATGYITDAEKRHSSMVFEPGLEEFRWINDSTASWRFPNGVSRGGINDKMDHPVTAISYSDVTAYCQWAGYRLPTLDEWEVASRANATTRYWWGNNRDLIGEYANIWHGRDHLQADSSDGYMYTAPVASFKPNPWGLYDMYGNVFEFCSGHTKHDKPGSTMIHARGGSWWCSKNSCNFFNSVDIGGQNLHASFSNQGFRVAR